MLVEGEEADVKSNKDAFDMIMTCGNFSMKCVPVSNIGIGWISWGRQMDLPLSYEKKAMKTHSTPICVPYMEWCGAECQLV